MKAIVINSYVVTFKIFYIIRIKTYLFPGYSGSHPPAAVGLLSQLLLLNVLDFLVPVGT